MKASMGMMRQAAENVSLFDEKHREQSEKSAILNFMRNRNDEEEPIEQHPDVSS